MISDARESIIRARFDASLFTPSAITAAAEQFLSTHHVQMEFFAGHATVALVPRNEDAPDVSAALADAVVTEALRQALQAIGRPSGPTHGALNTVQT